MAAISLPLVVSSVILATATALTVDGGSGCSSPTMAFSEFVETYGRTYEAGTEEYESRRAIFEQRAAKISSHNCDPSGPWTARISHLADWTPAELKSLRGHRSMRRAGQGGAVRGRMPFLLANRGSKSFEKPLPKDFSWGHLAAIQENSTDQKACGSCWAHAAKVTMQSRAEIKGLKHVGLSANQIIACTPNPKHCGGEGGCEGATAELAYEYVLNNGLMKKDDYLSLSGNEDPKTECPSSLRASSEVATRGVLGADGNEQHRVGTARLTGATTLGLTGWTKLAENKEETLVRELMNNGPVYVAVAAGDHWFDYSEGVMTEESCDRDNIVNHAVVLFAWGVKEKTVRGPVKYWQIKNSWGPTWGEHGTGRFIRTDNEEKVCGWDENPQDGSGCDGGPEHVWVCGTCGILYDAVAPHF